MKFSRWSENGTVQKIFDEMQKIGLIKTDTDVLCIDSTIIKVHPDAAGVRKSNGTRTLEDDKTRSLAARQEFIPVVPPKKNRKEPWDYDMELYKRHNEVERYFLRLKRFRKVFTRYDKLSSIFLSVVTLAMIFDAIFM